MSRRITSNTVKNNDSDEAIQPRHDDHIARVKEAPLQEPEAQASNDHSGVTVFHVTSTKEVKREGGTASSRVDHREETLIIYEHLPQSTAYKEVAGGDRATQPSGSDQRLVELVRGILKRLDKLLFDCFLQEFAKEFGKEAAKALAAILKWLFVALALFLLFRC
jgi:hypothetical protein